ncbi:MAG: diguanylate cyclase [Phormidesmis sp.]
MNSVLLIGNDSFTTSVMSQVRSLDALSVTAVATVAEALRAIGQKVPDVAIVQARQLVEGSVVRTFYPKKQGIYFVVIEESALGSAEAVLTASCQSVLLLERYLESTAGALEAGADAYLWLPPCLNMASLPERDAAIAVKADQPVPIHNPIYKKRLSPPFDHSYKYELTHHFSQGQPVEPDQEICQGIRQEVGQPSSAFHPSQSRLIQAHVQMGLNRAQRDRDLSRINDWLSAIALVDALTQLGNRRSFDLELPNQIKIARKKGAPLSLMVVDIDFFKSVNDRYGHLVGDDVLRMLAKRLLDNMRFYDMPFRYGGEEFVITLSNTDLDEGGAIAERLRQLIAQKPFEISHGIEASDPLALTVSIGLSALRPEDDAQGRSFLHRADQNLLRAKAVGRNRVVSG